MVAPKSEKLKRKLKVDRDYIDNMRLSFYYEKLINSLPFWLESQKTEDEASALSDVTDYLHTVLQLNQQQTLAYSIIKKNFQEKYSCHLV